MNAVFYLNDDLIFNRKRKNKNKNNDYHNHDEFNENKTIDARI
jgi:hypothetical protein